MNLLGPLEKSHRLPLVDAIRGLALLGILLANIPFADQNPDMYKQENIIPDSKEIDNILQFLYHLLIDKKFITIFSIFFGLGFYIQFKRAEEEKVRFKPYFIKRMLILLLLGCIHAYLFWFGDIIRDYAICGFFLLFIYKWQVKRILIIALVFSVFLTGTVFILNGALGLQEYNYDTAIISEHPVTSSYLRYLVINFTVDPLINFIQDSPLTLVFCFGNMLIGFCLGKLGFFHRPEQFRKLTRRFIWMGFIFGLTASYLFWLVSTKRLELSPTLLWLPFIIVAGLVLQSLFYISVFVRLIHHKTFHKFLSLFIPVGRMAITNYLLQTFFYLVIFFHWTHGFQLYGKLTLTVTYILAIFLFVLQIFFSRWWLMYHEQGPVEYVWKNLAYKFSSPEPNQQ